MGETQRVGLLERARRSVTVQVIRNDRAYETADFTYLLHIQVKGRVRPVGRQRETAAYSGTSIRVGVVVLRSKRCAYHRLCF